MSHATRSLDFAERLFFGPDEGVLGGLIGRCRAHGTDYSVLIGRFHARGTYTLFSLVDFMHVRHIILSDWSISCTWNIYSVLIGGFYARGGVKQILFSHWWISCT